MEDYKTDLESLPVVRNTPGVPAHSPQGNVWGIFLGPPQSFFHRIQQFTCWIRQAFPLEKLTLHRSPAGSTERCDQVSGEIPAQQAQPVARNHPRGPQ